MKIKGLRKKLLKLALVLFVLTIAVFTLTYLFFHYMTPEGFSAVKQAVPGKPLLTDMLAFFGVDLLTGTIGSALAALIVADKEKAERGKDE